MKKDAKSKKVKTVNKKTIITIAMVAIVVLTVVGEIIYSRTHPIACEGACSSAVSLSFPMLLAALTAEVVLLCVRLGMR